MKYLEAKRLAGQKAWPGPPENKAIPGPDANKEEWPMKQSPAQYIALNADSENPDVQAKVALARRLLEDDE